MNARHAALRGGAGALAARPRRGASGPPWPTSSPTSRSPSRSSTSGASGVADRRGYWLAAIGGVFIPWNLATLLGYLGGQAVPDPRLLGLDVVFPAAMAGLAVGLATGRREVVALAAGVVDRRSSSASPSIPRVGVVAGGLLGPAVGLAVPRRDRDVPEPDELPADPDAFARPDRSEDGMLP